ncbi:unnamed protein product [Parascedosporium putredinis]|uniref:Mitochondrial intermediate peptidase n=1 Tax=Parascedosporium putredinis TaxID=1442378 RepID=A0A9P1MCI6_9PEZI|nr:unnamed protein product [Parascedosporium putredinis]CAI7998488.1 unnamed protein product [Parascedosporium putredinis]
MFKAAAPGCECARPVFAAAHPQHTPSYPSEHDVIREVFDQPDRASKWFSSTSPAARLRPTGKSAGLFKNRYLTRPEGFQVFAYHNLQRASQLVDRILHASTVDEYRQVVRNLDRLSDLLCRAAASDAWGIVYQYMNQLNTTTGLNDQLCKAMDNPDVTSAWSEEEAIVAKTLRIDFENEVGTEFVGTMAPEKYTVQLPAAKFTGLRPDILAAHTRGSYVRLGAVGGATTSALRTVLDEDVRKALYLASNTASRRTVGLLEEMLRLRAELAALTGFESFAHQNMKDRVMAKTPAAVVRFLEALQKHNAPIVQQEVADLLQVKKARLGAHHTQLFAWDREFCAQTGLSILYSRLYGIRLVPRETLPGEVWHPDVRRLDVVSDKGALLAVLYCDLFYREAKSQNPAHYTIRCSRDILDGEIEEVALDAGREGLPKFDSAEMAANDGMEAVREGGVLKQLPTIALTLFHEMGHAVHSFLARTSFQTVAGTRCATDLAELPSTLMEHFAVDPTVLGLFARHWKSGEPVPYDRVAARVRASKRFEGLQTERQIILAMADQALHSPPPATRPLAPPPPTTASRPTSPPGEWRVAQGKLLRWGGSRDPWRCLADTLSDERIAAGDEKAMAIVGSWGIKDEFRP